MSRASRPWIGFGLAVLLVLVWGIGWGLFTHVRTQAYVGGSVPAGQPWTDPLTGTTYTVVETETHKRIQRTESTAEVAPDGAIFLLVHMTRVNVTEESVCYLDLIGPERMRWTAEVFGLPESYGRCSYEEASTDYWMTYVVPERLVDEVLGVTIHFTTWNHNPAMELPPPGN
ncbi:hypothetical protein ACPCG0_09635 [Propionibacteriaceae bacterium Y1923]